MAQPAPQLASWHDVLTAPDGVKVEVIDGELFSMSPRPAPIHGFLQAGLASALFSRPETQPAGEAGWWIVVEPDVALGPHDIVSPDLVGWRRQTTPNFPAEQPITTIPDWVCEVLSPRTARRDRTTKADLYLGAGVGHYWLVEPDAEVIEAFAAREGGWLRLAAFSGATPAVIAPFDVPIDVAGLFPPAASSGDA